MGPNGPFELPNILFVWALFFPTSVGGKRYILCIFSFLLKRRRVKGTERTQKWKGERWPRDRA